ncbi:MBL fold metallo-hydrolase [bacterium]|nr:MBL fold metallo-hydrolase [bacterium]
MGRISVVALILVVALFVSIPAFSAQGVRAGQMHITYFDVGQGDAILIQTPFGQNILIDGGEDEKIIKSLSEELPWWDKRIDLMILTHPHSDHVGGLLDVLKRYDVLKILYTGAIHNSPDYIAWLKLIEEKKIDLNIINHPQKILLGDDLFLDIIYPRAQTDIDSQKNLNNTSIVAKLIYGQTSFLFMGDSEIEVEEILLEDKNKLSADVLKLGHHGSDTSSSADFLEIVDPDYAVIEVGEANRFDHPSPRIIKRLERADIEIFRTDIDGSIQFISNGVDLRVNN